MIWSTKRDSFAFWVKTAHFIIENNGNVFFKASLTPLVKQKFLFRDFNYYYLAYFY